MDNIARLIAEHGPSVHTWSLEAPAAAILVTILYFVLKRNLFEPLEAVLKARADVLSGASKTEQDAAAREESATRKREGALQKAFAEAASLREKARVEAQVKVDAMLAEARARAEKSLHEALVQIEEEIEHSRAVLERESHDLAQMFVARLIEPKENRA